MTYRVIKPPPQLDYGPRGGSPLGFVWHHAEGTNVALYLARNPARGVSVNFTIEQATSSFADGEVIAMVPIDHASGTVNPRTIRASDDPVGSDGQGGRFGATLAKAVLGAKWKDPNRWLIGIELAGRGVDGPNPAQVASMVRLVADMRKRFPGLKGNLGHRDFQTVKPCPNRHIPWDQLGGHGLFGSSVTQGDEMLVDLNPFRTAVVAVGTSLAERSGGPEVAKVTSAQRRSVPGYSFDLDYAMVASDFGANPGKSRGYFVKKAALSEVKIETPVDCPDCEDCTAEAEAAKSLGYNEAITEEQAWALTRVAR